MRIFGIVTAILCGSFFLVGCATSRPQKTDIVLDQLNQLSLQVHSLEEQNQTLQQKYEETDQAIAQLEDEISQLRGKQEAQIKRILDEVAIATGVPTGIKMTNAHIQKALKAAGYDVGSIDGKIGPKTRNAIIAFQKANGMNPDGVVAGSTWARLQKYLDSEQK